MDLPHCRFVSTNAGLTDVLNQESDPFGDDGQELFGESDLNNNNAKDNEELQKHEKEELQKHEKVRFTCDICGNQFIMQRNLKRHQFLLKCLPVMVRDLKVSSSDRTLNKAFITISNMCDRINLPKTIIDRANNLFKMVSDGKNLNLKGRANDAIAAACLYIACRQEGVPRTFKEIEAVSTVSKKEIGRRFKLILKAHDTSVELITSGDFMSRFCGTLFLSRDVQKAATSIAKKAVDLDIVRMSPISVAAAAIYMASQASDDKRTRREIADIAGVADETIKQNYKLMLHRAAELFPPGNITQDPALRDNILSFY